MIKVTNFGEEWLKGFRAIEKKPGERWAIRVELKL